MRFRSRFIRLGLVSLGLMLLPLGAYLGLGYVVHRRVHWFEKTLGYERWLSLLFAYMRASAALLPQDSDGDFQSDGAELFVGTDPESDRDRIETEWLASEWETLPFGDDRLFHASLGIPAFLFEPGERRRIRARIGYLKQRLPFAAGAKIRIGGEGFDGGPVTVPVAADGMVEFELRAVDGSGSVFPRTQSIIASHPAKLQIFGGLMVQVTWRLPVVSCVVEPQRLPEQGSIPGRTGASRVAVPSRGSVARLRWPEVTGADVLFIEATSDGQGEGAPPAQWFVVAGMRADATTCMVAYWNREALSKERGPLRFRVAPMRFRPLNRDLERRTPPWKPMEASERAVHGLPHARFMGDATS